MRPKRSVRNWRYWWQPGQRAGPRSTTSGLRAAARFELIARRRSEAMDASEAAPGRLWHRTVDERVVAHAQAAVRRHRRSRDRRPPARRALRIRDEPPTAMSMNISHG